ncbi:transcriptional regulator, TetR family [Goodfellowiella coeruleoviolacea]|uniref:Transcriptional regulator, TetR family n=1 Tax=Goodfellowiella coeruleoviolacea TaxID=334858 RepID=A0AAE3GEN4_9PSEU|nr:transcriptional regulator, TetR family [Goodfellowiella coeruleoviolacea]
MLLAAAKQVFSEQGYTKATVRTIATRAGVDPAMVNHWFGGKERLFAEAVLDLPVTAEEVIGRVLHEFDGNPSGLGERIVRAFLTTWDSSEGGGFAALVRSVATHEAAAAILKDVFLNRVFDRIAEVTGPDQGQFRATLCATQLIGLGMIRYVAKFEPMASADIDTVVAAVAPTLQRYLTGDLTGG